VFTCYIFLQRTGLEDVLYDMSIHKMMQLKIAGNQVLPFWPFTTYQVVCHVHRKRLHVNLFVHIFRLPVLASEVVPPCVAEIAIAPAQSSMELGLELLHTVTDETDCFPVLALTSTANYSLDMVCSRITWSHSQCLLTWRILVPKQV
jgi:hypothetical protein